jgi:octaprenyl-diphosphate synthase
MRGLASIVDQLGRKTGVRHKPARSLIVAIVHAQASRKGANRAFHGADAGISNMKGYASLAQQSVEKAQEHLVVGADDLPHALSRLGPSERSAFALRQFDLTNSVPDMTITPQSTPEQQLSESGTASLGVVVSIGDAREPASGLKSIVSLVADDMAGVNRIILDKAVSDVELIPKLAHHLIDSGGKRLRPMLTIAGAKLAGYLGDGHVRLAASVEFMHTATLLHDDVVDGSDFRRGKKSARLIWGNQASVLVGDFLLGQAFRMMVDVGSLPCLKILSNAAAVIAEGEVMQLAAAKNMATTEDEYLAIINAKTAALFAAATEVGPALAGRPGEEQAALRSYGRNLGIAFQLVDDALDYAGDSERLGKSVGDDFREGKITLPVILAFRRGSESEREFWRDSLVNGRTGDGELATAIALIRKYKAVEATLERARTYGAMAQDALAIFPDSAAKSALADVVGFCVSRTH